MLNDKEKCFANEYIINKGNAFQAALAAGYAKSTAKHAYQWIEDTQQNPTMNRKLPFKPELAELIKQKLEEMDSAKTMSAKEVVELLSSIARGEVQDSQVVVEGVGDGCSEARVVDTPASLKDRLVAAKELAKIHGIESSSMNINVEPVVIVNDLSE